MHWFKNYFKKICIENKKKNWFFDNFLYFTWKWYQYFPKMNNLTNTLRTLFNRTDIIIIFSRPYKVIYDKITFFSNYFFPQPSLNIDHSTNGIEVNIFCFSLNLGYLNFCSSNSHVCLSTKFSGERYTWNKIGFHIIANIFMPNFPILYC